MNAQTTQIPMAEQKLVAAAFGGDRDAFGQLVIMYQTPVFGTCMRYLKGEDAKDAAQEVFIKAFIHRETFSADRAVLPWLLTITRNLCIDRLRKYRPETSIDEPLAEPPGNAATAEETLASKQSLEIVQQQMAKLPEGQREAIVLHHVEGLAYREISDVLGVPEGTVMTWLHRGRKAIVTALRRSG